MNSLIMFDQKSKSGLLCDEKQGSFSCHQCPLTLHNVAISKGCHR